MYHYQFNIGDYRKDTAHLTVLEHGVYRLLLDTYYLTEVPLTSDHKQLARLHCLRTAEEKTALDVVLSDFFELTDDGYRHHGCEKVMARVYEKSEKARESARRKWDRKKTETCERIESKCERTEKECERNENVCEQHAPDMLPVTRNPEPVTRNPNKAKSCLSDTQKIGKKFSARTCELPSLVNPAAWIEWAEARSAKKKPISENAAKKQWAILSGYSFADQQQIVDKSIANDYQGLFHLDGSKNKKEVSFVEKYSDRSWADGFIERHTDDGWRKGL